MPWLAPGRITVKAHAHVGGKRNAFSDRPLNAQIDAPVYAALDLGTNNCRLLIATPQESGGVRFPSLKIIDSFSRIVRLGEGLGAKGGLLSEDAKQRTLKALRTCRQKLDKFPQAKVRFVATEACRRAANAPQFLKQVEAEMGIHIEIISNEEEAKLAFYGCSSLMQDHAKKALTFDIGGGSTEFMWAMRDEAGIPQIAGWTSIPYGVMNLSEQSGGTAYAEMYYDEMVGRLVSTLSKFDAVHNIADAIDEGGVQLLSTSGTVTTLAAIHLELPRYDRSKVDGSTMAIADLLGAIQALKAMSPSERYHHPCIGNQRADYIISGCAILDAIAEIWPFANITIADRGVREGIIMGILLGENSQEKAEN